MSANLPQKAVVLGRLDQCRKIIGGDHDPFALAWADMAASERSFWLQLVRAPYFLANRTWAEIPGQQKALILSAIRRTRDRLNSICERAAA